MVTFRGGWEGLQGMLLEREMWVGSRRGRSRLSFAVENEEIGNG